MFTGRSITMAGVGIVSGGGYFAAFDCISTNYLNVAGSLHASAADVQSLWKRVKIYPAKLLCILSI